LTLDQIENGATGDVIDDARKRLQAYPGGITYVHCPGATASRVATQARRLHAQGLCNVAIVDYLQKLTLVHKQGQNKADHLGDAAETLKIAAERLGIPFLLGSQFNRGVDHVARKTGAYIRGSGEPHEKANAVITLDRAILGSDAFDEEGRVIASAGQRSPVMVVRVDKNTGGETGDTKLVMNAARFLILDPVPRCG
jgi:replicative DNA helicase